MERISNVQARAALSEGRSQESIHRLVAKVLRATGDEPRTLVDVGCGTGQLARSLAGLFKRYIGCDILTYEGFPREKWARFVHVDLNVTPFPLEDGVGDVVVAVETIEHLENPRAFFRELVRLARPGGLVIVTTPNQLSLLSKVTLMLRNEFNAFQESAGLYPAHITALLEADLRHIARECGLEGVAVHYTDSGRIPFMPLHWPAGLGFRGRWFSDNVLVCGRRTS